jgi:hypothetical protein
MAGALLYDGTIASGCEPWINSENDQVLGRSPGLILRVA